jgi:drug/metabolite transporter (DMT)-like permease
MDWTGYLLALVSMVSLSFVGILSKLAERRGCSPLATTSVVLAASTVMMLIYGVVTTLAFWVFLYGIRFGKISTSWVVISLSAVVPTILSTVIYRERVGWRKFVVLTLVVIAVLLLWKDVQAESQKAERGIAAPSIPTNP